MTITYTRPVYDQFDSTKLLKKRATSKQIGATSYSTVRLLDYLDEIQKMRDSPHYMFGRHSLTPWYSNNFIDSMSISIYKIMKLDAWWILRSQFDIGHCWPFYRNFKISMKKSLLNRLEITNQLLKFSGKDSFLRF